MIEFKIMGSESFSFQTYRPFFDRSDYLFWKHKMELYLDSDPIRLWEVVLQGWSPPTENMDNVQVILDRAEWSTQQ